MGKLIRPKPVKLVASLIYRDKKSLAIAEKELIRSYGMVEPLMKELPFDDTDYYKKEFGDGLERKLICFKKMLDLEKIAQVKIRSNIIERRLACHGNRRVNIDPGYVNDAKLILLTTKDYTHRVHIGGGIFAESTLYFKDGGFRAWPWTYPDYASSKLVSYFEEVRFLYLADIRKMKSAGKGLRPRLSLNIFKKNGGKRAPDKR